MKSLASNLEAARTNVYREHISHAAERVFAEHGYERATIRQIAAEADVSVGSVYGVFEGKADLYLHVHQRHYARLAELSAAATRTGSDCMSVLMAGARITADYFCNHPDFLRIQIKSGQAWAFETRENEVRDAAWVAGWQLITQTIAGGIDAGELRPGKPERFARVIMAGYQAILVDWLASGAVDSPDAVCLELEDLVRRILLP
jgi:AcrR family transcriptional regulator